MVQMKRSILLLAALGLTGLVIGTVRSGAQQEPAVEPWQIGSCYRVFRVGEESFDLVKVLSREGPWIGFEPDPRAPWVPGSRPQARVWLNVSSVSVVQEWPCSNFP
jgi:hypothetical protein